MEQWSKFLAQMLIILIIALAFKTSFLASDSPARDPVQQAPVVQEAPL